MEDSDSDACTCYDKYSECRYDHSKPTRDLYHEDPIYAIDFIINVLFPITRTTREKIEVFRKLFEYLLDHNEVLCQSKKFRDVIVLKMNELRGIQEATPLLPLFDEMDDLLNKTDSLYTMNIASKQSD